MSGVFICYRKADTRHLAGRLYSDLCKEFGPQLVFRDSASLRGGDRWPRRLLERVTQSDVLLVLIGEKWLTLINSTKDSDEDWVQNEINAAKAAGVRVIPILVDGAVMPTEAELPPDISELATYQALPLHDGSYEAELRSIIENLVDLPPLAAGQAAALEKPGRRQAWGKKVAVGLAAAMIVGLALWQVDWQNDETQAPLEQMDGAFNIAISGLETPNSEDQLNGSTVGTTLKTALLELAPERYLIWGPSDVGVIPESEVATRADELNAHLLVYGALEDAGFGDYRVTINVHTGKQNERAPWPLDLEEIVTFTVPPSKVVDGSLADNNDVNALVQTLDGLAALLGDSLDIANDRLEAAQQEIDTAIGPDGEIPAMWAVVPSLRAYVLLVDTVYNLDDSNLGQAAALSDDALAIDAASELAHLVSFSTRYLQMVPVGPPVPTACVSASPPPVPPEPALVDQLARDITSYRDGTGRVTRLQLTSLLARLALAKGTSPPPDETALAEAEFSFSEIISEADSDPTLSFWASDSHRGLAILSLLSGEDGIEVTIDHLLAAIEIDTPIWRARDLALAGWIHRCFPGGSQTEAVCYYLDAADRAIDNEAQTFRNLANEIRAESAVDCPPGWSSEPTPAD